MVNNPIVGETYWMVVDIWEQYAAVPVTIISQQSGGTFTARWNITDEYHEDYDGTEPGQLYPSEFGALVEIKRLRAAERKDGST